MARMSSSADEPEAVAAAPQRRATPVRRAILPVRFRAFRAPVWWHEVMILVILNFTYERLRNLVPAHEQVAINRADKLFHFTQSIHWDVELSINHWVASQSWLAEICNYYYSFLHLPVTASVLIWLFWKHPRVYRSARSVLLLTTAIALTSFWLLPMAPPRLLPDGGFVDTLVNFHTFGSWGDPKVASHTNQFAAMPSLHCAWAIWVAACVFSVAKHKWVRYAALAYPVCTIFVVVGTANHFVLDAVAGAAVLTLAFAVQVALTGHGVFEHRRDREELEASGNGFPLPSPAKSAR